jgi:hypothetical protein
MSRTLWPLATCAGSDAPREADSLRASCSGGERPSHWPERGARAVRAGARPVSRAAKRLIVARRRGRPKRRVGSASAPGYSSPSSSSSPPPPPSSSSSSSSSSRACGARFVRSTRCRGEHRGAMRGRGGGASSQREQLGRTQWRPSENRSGARRRPNARQGEIRVFEGRSVCGWVLEPSQDGVSDGGERGRWPAVWC